MRNACRFVFTVNRFPRVSTITRILNYVEYLLFSRPGFPIKINTPKSLSNFWGAYLSQRGFGVLQFVANVGIAFLLLIAGGFLTVFERLLALRKTQLCLRQNKQSAKCCAVCFVVAFGVYEKSIFLRQMLLQNSLLKRNVNFAVNRLFFPAMHFPLFIVANFPLFLAAQWE